MDMIKDYANDSLDIWADFIGKGRKNSNGYDVLLSTSKSGEHGKRVTVTFYGKACDTVSNFARIKLSSLKKVPDRMYFALYAVDDSRLGYSISKGKDENIRIAATIPADEIDLIENQFRGYYDLKFEAQLGLYYIDLNERKK